MSKEESRPHDFNLIPWEEVAIQLDEQEKALYDVAFAAARSKIDVIDLVIYGRRYVVSPSGKVWLMHEVKSK